MLHAASTIRGALPADADALAQLAVLTNAGLSRGPALVAERGADVIATIALTSGEVVVDPLRADNEVVRRLRRRRYELLRQGGSVGHARSLLMRGWRLQCRPSGAKNNNDA